MKIQIRNKTHRRAKDTNHSRAIGKCAPRIACLLAVGVFLWSPVAQAANKVWDTSDWPHRTAAERSRIVSLMHNHETILVLDLLRQGKQQQAQDVLFSILDLSLMDVSAPNKPYSPGEWKTLCEEISPLGKLETSKMLRAYSHRKPKRAADIRSRITTLKKNCTRH